MPLATEEKSEIVQLIRAELPMILQTVRPYPTHNYEMELRERIVRVEEELKHQREIMMEGFKRMDERFEAMQIQMDKRFDAVDKRFGEVDKRFRLLQWTILAGFSFLSIFLSVLSYFAKTGFFLRGL